MAVGCLIRVKVRFARLKRYTKTKRAQPNRKQTTKKIIKKEKLRARHTDHDKRRTGNGEDNDDDDAATSLRAFWLRRRRRRNAKRMINRYVRTAQSERVQQTEREGERKRVSQRVGRAQADRLCSKHKNSPADALLRRRRRRRRLLSGCKASAARLTAVCLLSPLYALRLLTLFRPYRIENALLLLTKPASYKHTHAIS